MSNVFMGQTDRVKSRANAVSLGLAVALLCSCSSVTLVRTGNATSGGQPGSLLAPRTISQCNVLGDLEQRGACVYTVEECQYGIAEVRARRSGRKTEFAIRCLIPGSVTDWGDSGDL